MAFTDLSLEIAAEFSGFAGAREFFDAEGYSFRRLGKMDNDDVRRIGAVLRANAWAKANPERRREIARRWWSSEKGRAAKARKNAKNRARREAAAKKWAPLVCAECGREFKRLRTGPRPKFCSNPCWARARYQRITPGAKRIRRHYVIQTDAERKLLRIEYQRTWARKQKEAA